MKFTGRTDTVKSDRERLLTGIVRLSYPLRFLYGEAGHR